VSFAIPQAPHRADGHARPLPGAPPLLVAGAVGAGLLAAWVLPESPPGVGLLLVAVAITAAVALAEPRAVTAESVVFAALGLALAAMTAVRAAPWVLAVDAVFALGLASLVVVGGSTWGQLIRAPLLVAARSPIAPAFLWRGVRPRTTGRLSPVLRGVGLGAVLLALFGTLFASADRAFAHLAGQYLIPDLDLLPLRVLVFSAVVVMTASYAAAGPRFVALGVPRPLQSSVWSAALREEGRAPRRLGRTEWGIALGLLDLLFAAFVAIQVTVLFGGHDHVLSTAGLTYAEYAREGFFQLLAVGLLTLAVVAGAVRWAARGAGRDGVLLRVLLGILCALTLVVLASALRRLGLYEDAFGFTRARITAHAVILWLGAVLLLVMAAGLKMRGWWLPRTVIGVSAVSLLVFTLANPDGLVAARNVARYRETGKIDLVYLSTLSADATPALADLPPPLEACVLSMSTVPDDLRRAEPWYAWNLGRERARDALASGVGASCRAP
jgi:Domain of unknown function (DUF4173)